MLVTVYDDEDEKAKRKAHIIKMNAQINQNHSKQMAMTATECNRLMLENAKKSAKKGGKLLKRNPLSTKGQPKPQKTTRGK